MVSLGLIVAGIIGLVGESSVVSDPETYASKNERDDHEQTTRLQLPISLDGYGAGPAQTLEQPLGQGAESLHEWMVTTRTFKQLFGREGGTTGPDDDFTARGFENIGAWILGRNMFGPVRGSWPDESWRGWWGETPSLSLR